MSLWCIREGLRLKWQGHGTATPPACSSTRSRLLAAPLVCSDARSTQPAPPFQPVNPSQPCPALQLAGLSRLTSLRFCACNFAHLPASLSGLTALRQLALEVLPASGGMGLVFGTSKRLTFAPQLSSLTRLESLEFYGCGIRELPPAIAGMKARRGLLQMLRGGQTMPAMCRAGQKHPKHASVAATATSALPPVRRIVVSGGAIEVHDHFFVQQPSALGLSIPEGLLLGLENLEVRTERCPTACPAGGCTHAAVIAGPAGSQSTCLPGPSGTGSAVLRQRWSEWPCHTLSHPKPAPHPALPCYLQEVILRSCGFQGPRAAIHLPPSVKRVAVTGAHKLEGVDFGPHATGLQEGAGLREGLLGDGLCTGWGRAVQGCTHVSSWPRRQLCCTVWVLECPLQLRCCPRPCGMDASRPPLLSHTCSEPAGHEPAICGAQPGGRSQQPAHAEHVRLGCRAPNHTGRWLPTGHCCCRLSPLVRCQWCARCCEMSG